ncbi:MAG: 50S ribosomal protein L17 [Patescibacteria group bacterium]|jgi:large subunit ribosomal protein L17
MKKRVFGKKLGRNHHQRQALFKSLAKSMFSHGVVETTEAKAKAVTPTIEKLCAVALKNDLIAHRYFHRHFQDKKLVTRVIAALNKSFSDRNSNFTKLTRVKRRQGDDALVVKMSFTKPYSLNEKEEAVENQKTSKPESKTKTRAKKETVKAVKTRKVNVKKEQK